MWLADKKKLAPARPGSGVYILAIFPPLKGGEKNRHFLKFGEENRPWTEKKFEKKKISNFISNVFLIINNILKSNTENRPISN